MRGLWTTAPSSPALFSFSRSPEILIQRFISPCCGCGARQHSGGPSLVQRQRSQDLTTRRRAQLKGHLLYPFHFVFLFLCCLSLLLSPSLSGCVTAKPTVLQLERQSEDHSTEPFAPIDTCCPAGKWVHEKRYNRSRPTGESSRKVLCGNWLEERALENDLLGLERETEAAKRKAQEESARTGTEVRAPRSWHDKASLDLIKNRGNGRFDGGFNSTPYIDRDVARPEDHDLNTTYLTDYTQKNADVRRLRRPDLGVRSQLFMQRALAMAEAEQKANLESRTEQFHEEGPRESVYRATICRPNENYPTVEELDTDYLVDEPITLYTGNPYTSKTMVVHGKTPNDPLSKPYHGKHTYFSDPKYAI
eukprot:gene9110-6401_t